ncbi:MAG: homocysteine S-methyltransferase family protein [Chloroflexota bacterium]
MTSLAERLAQNEVIIIDGATGTEIEKHGGVMNDEAWSVAAVDTHPDIVRRVHEDYIQAGADLIITNTFGTSKHMTEKAGLGDRFESLNAKAVKIAQQARENVANRPIAIAGGVSSTTFGGKQPPLDIAKINYEAQVDILAENGADILVLEMMRRIDYTKVIINAAKRTGLPIWVGFSLNEEPDEEMYLLGNKTETLADAVKSIVDMDVDLICIMHTQTEWAKPALEVIKKHWSGPMGAYPHSGEFIWPNWQFNNVITPKDFADAAEEWVAMGAQVIGGCCGIGLDHIRELKSRLPTNIV